jgi:hypothetical protein
LHAIAGIKSAVVIAKNDILIAYIVPDFDLHNQQDQIRLWRAELQSSVACFHGANVFHILDKMPVTAGDKIDRAALLEYQFRKNRGKNSSTNGRGEISCIHLGKSLNIKQLDIFSNLRIGRTFNQGTSYD